MCVHNFLPALPMENVQPNGAKWNGHYRIVSAYEEEYFLCIQHNVRFRMALHASIGVPSNGSFQLGNFGSIRFEIECESEILGFFMIT